MRRSSRGLIRRFNLIVLANARISLITAERSIFGSGFTRTSFATGRPRRVMITSRPASAYSTSSDSLDFAS